MVNYPLFPPQNEDVVGFARTWWHLRQALAGNGVLIDSNDPNGMKVTRASASSVNVAAGHYANKGIWKAYAGASPAIESIPAASAGYHRYDSICVKLSDNTIARVAGTEAVPDTAADFLENFTPLPADLNSTDYIELSILCIDENGIRSTDNGTYSVGGVADVRPPFVAGLDDSTLKISADGKLEVQDLYPLRSTLTTRGDLYQMGSASIERLAKGAENTIVAAGADQWEAKTLATLLDTILTTRGDLLYRPDGTSARLAKGAANTILKMGASDPAWSTVSSLLDSVLGSTEGMVAKRGAAAWSGEVRTSYRYVLFLPQSFGYPATNPAELIEWVGTNTTRQEARFDDTTEEFVTGGFPVPADYDSSGTITIQVMGRSLTAAASKNVAFTFRHLPLADSEAMDAAYTSSASGDSATDATQGDLEVHSWTVGTPGWTAGDWVDFKLSRNPGATDDLTGDWCLRSMILKIPVTG